MSITRTHGADPDAAADTARRFVTLSEAGDAVVADGVVDSRGWPVLTPNGRAVGRVVELVLDRTTTAVRIVVLAHVGGGPRREARVPGEPVLVPVEFVQVDARARSVSLDRAALAVLEVLPRSDGRRITREQIALLDAVRTAIGGTAPRADVQARSAVSPVASDAASGADVARVDASPPHATVRSDDARTHRIVLHEEQLHVAGTRAIPAGEVTVRKVVETMPVARSLMLSHDEVEIERRPGTAESPMQATIGDDEIVIPILEERIVVEKRVFVREEVVVRRRTATRTETLTDTVRRERLVTEGPVHVRGTDPATPRDPGASAAPDPRDTAR